MTKKISPVSRHESGIVAATKPVEQTVREYLASLRTNKPRNLRIDPNTEAGFMTQAMREGKHVPTLLANEYTMRAWAAVRNGITRVTQRTGRRYSGTMTTDRSSAEEEARSTHVINPDRYSELQKK